MYSQIVRWGWEGEKSVFIFLHLSELNVVIVRVLLPFEDVVGLVDGFYE